MIRLGKKNELKYKELNVPFSISPSTPFISMQIGECEADKGLKFFGYDKNNKEVTIEVRFERMLEVKMCCMTGDSRGAPGRIGEIINSPWLKELNDNQKAEYPSFPDNFKDMHHYYFNGHDCNIEVISEGFSWKLI